MCKQCHGKCAEQFSDTEPMEYSCPFCEEGGCEICNNRGRLRITECPSKYIGVELIHDLNVIAMCEGGVMPVAGGVLDQSPWFLNLKRTIDGDLKRIRDEKTKDAKRG